MNPSQTKEVNSLLSKFQLAEVIASASAQRLDGALRVTELANKTVVYFKEGRVVYAASNQKKHRLFQMILDARILTAANVAKIPNFTNDLELAQGLLQLGAVDEATLVGMLNLQVRQIITDGFEWNEGSWVFTPFAKVKEELHQRIDVATLLCGHARSMKNIQVGKRFKSFKEHFRPNPSPPSQISLAPDETFVLAAYDGKQLSVTELAETAGMKDHDLIKTVYTLWLGGFLIKDPRLCAFTDEDAERLLGAHANARRRESAVSATASSIQISVEHLALGINEDQQRKAREISLEVYLKQVERAADHYETLSVKPSASVEEIKKSYFSLAKRFHPDRFYRQIDAPMMKRVQAAFSNIAHAYETLRKDDTRRSYDFKIGKNQLSEEAAERAKPRVRAANEATDEAQRSFDEGFTALMGKQIPRAILAFAKAVDLSPNVGRFHAYYAKALAVESAQRFKAETHYQTAIRLEPENTSFRLMFAEFLIAQNLKKRAEAELERLLKVAPDHTDARSLLDSLQHK